LNSLESSPNLSFQNLNNHLQTENKRNNQNFSQTNNNNNNKPVVLRMLKDTANLLTESVNVCGSNGSKHVESSVHLINNSKEAMCSPITSLKHKNSFMKRIFTRSKSKDKSEPFNRHKQISNNSNCTYASVDDSNDGSHYNLTSVGRKASNSCKKAGKKC
jgi:hypothetical protein